MPGADGVRVALPFFYTEESCKIPNYLVNARLTSRNPHASLDPNPRVLPHALAFRGEIPVYVTITGLHRSCQRANRKPRRIMPAASPRLPFPIGQPPNGSTSRPPHLADPPRFRKRNRTWGKRGFRVQWTMEHR